MYHIMFYDEMAHAYRRIQRKDRFETASLIRKIRRTVREKVFVFQGEKLLNGRTKAPKEHTKFNFGLMR